MSHLYIPHIFLITLELSTLVPVGSLTLSVKRIFVFGFDWYILNNSISLVVGPDAIPFAYIFEALP